MHPFLIHKTQSKIEPAYMIKKIRKPAEIIDHRFQKSPLGKNQGKYLQKNSTSISI